MKRGLGDVPNPSECHVDIFSNLTFAQPLLLGLRKKCVHTRRDTTGNVIEFSIVSIRSRVDRQGLAIEKIVW